MLSGLLWVSLLFCLGMWGLKSCDARSLGLFRFCLVFRCGLFVQGGKK